MAVTYKGIPNRHRWLQPEEKFKPKEAAGIGHTIQAAEIIEELTIVVEDGNGDSPEVEVEINKEPVLIEYVGTRSTPFTDYGFSTKEPIKSVSTDDAKEFLERGIFQEVDESCVEEPESEQVGEEVTAELLEDDELAIEE